MGWVRSANRLANKPYRQSAGFIQNANQFSETEKHQFLDFQTENRTKLTLYLAPRTGFEPAAYRLGVAPIRHREVTSNAKKCLEIQGFSAFQILSDTTL